MIEPYSKTIGAVCRSGEDKGDICTGHGAYPSRECTSGSPNVFVNGYRVHRQGDSWATHCDSEGDCHNGKLYKGSPTVFVNGKQLGRVGDSIDCGSKVATGSSNVFCGPIEED
jgi:uncharacterized Zn-binding protein involved in type VI secretion